jgi:methylated-DNA-[protein]-cysteine S-methyltransferase
MPPLGREALGHCIFDTALGPCAVVWSDVGLRHVMLPETSEARLRARIARELGLTEPVSPPAPVRAAIELVRRHLGGTPQDLGGIAVDLAGLGPFACRVYRALRRVEAGHTVSYAELARRAGSPRAARAVGQAMAHNPLALVVPCHRVLAANAQPGGFSAAGGATTKARLLAIEGIELALDRPARRRR